MVAALVRVTTAALATIVVPGPRMILVEVVVRVTVLVMIFTVLAAAVEALVMGPIVSSVGLAVDLTVLAVVAPMFSVVVVRHGRAGESDEGGHRGDGQQSLHAISNGRPPGRAPLP